MERLKNKRHILLYRHFSSSPILLVNGTFLPRLYFWSMVLFSPRLYYWSMVLFFLAYTVGQWYFSSSPILLVNGTFLPRLYCWSMVLFSSCVNIKYTIIKTCSVYNKRERCTSNVVYPGKLNCSTQMSWGISLKYWYSRMCDMGKTSLVCLSVHPSYIVCFSFSLRVSKINQATFTGAYVYMQFIHSIVRSVLVSTYISK